MAKLSQRRSKPSEESYCPICDYWWVLCLCFAAVTFLLLNHHYWWPTSTITSLLGVSTNDKVVFSTATPTNTWTNYLDKEWNFSLSVPTFIDEKKLLFIMDYGMIPTGPNLVLLLSDSTLATTQNIGPNESARVIIFRWKPDSMPFDQWAVLMSKYAGTGTLTTSLNGPCSELTVKVNQPVIPYNWASANWVNAGDYYFGILAQGIGNYPLEIDPMMNSFQPAECKQ